MEHLIKARVEPGRVGICWLGQGGFALKAHTGDLIVIDPYLSDSANHDGSLGRLQPAPIKPRSARLDFLFLTHDHADHTDPHTAPILAQVNPGAPVVCPPSSVRHLSKLGVPSAQLQTAMPGQRLEFRSFVAHVVPARHTEDSVGYVFEFNEAGPETSGPVVYVTGDTEYFEGLADAVADFGVDVLLVPINGRWGNMDAAHAARLAVEIGPRAVVPMHWGMFAQNTADPEEFTAHLAAAGGAEAGVAAVIMKHGGGHIFCTEQSAQGRHAQKQVRAERARQARRSHEHHDGVRGPGGR